IDAGLVAAPPVSYTNRARRDPPGWLAAPSAAPASHPVARRRGQTSPASIPEYQKNRFLGPFARLLASNQSATSLKSLVSSFLVAFAAGDPRSLAPWPTAARTV